MPETKEIRFPRRTAAKARTRQRIESAARRLFVELGYNDATMAAIADAADVHVTTLFTHFASKQDMMTAIAATAGERFEAAVATQRAAGVPVLGFWRNEVLQAATAYERDKAGQLKLGRALSAHPELLPAWIALQLRLITLMTDYIAADMQVDARADRRPRMAAAMLVAGGVMAFETWLASGQTGDLVAENQSLIDAAEAILRDGLGLTSPLKTGPLKAG